MLVSIRSKKNKRLLASDILSPYVGPSYVTRWILRQLKALKLTEGMYEYQIGKEGVWSS